MSGRTKRGSPKSFNFDTRPSATLNLGNCSGFSKIPCQAACLAYPSFTEERKSPSSTTDLREFSGTTMSASISSLLPERLSGGGPGSRLQCRILQLHYSLKRVIMTGGAAG